MKTMKQGFTLVEIMIVVAIIAILAAVAIPNFIKYRDDANTQACRANMKALQTAGESWLVNNPDGTPTIAALCGAGKDKYIKQEPKCKAGGAYTISVNEGSVVVTCSKGHTLEEETGGE